MLISHHGSSVNKHGFQQYKELSWHHTRSWGGGWWGSSCGIDIQRRNPIELQKMLRNEKEEPSQAGPCLKRKLRGTQRWQNQRREPVTVADEAGDEKGRGGATSAERGQDLDLQRSLKQAVGMVKGQYYESQPLPQRLAGTQHAIEAKQAKLKQLQSAEIWSTLRARIELEMEMERDRRHGRRGCHGPSIGASKEHQ